HALDEPVDLRGETPDGSGLAALHTCVGALDGDDFHVTSVYGEIHAESTQSTQSPQSTQSNASGRWREKSVDCGDWEDWVDSEQVDGINIHGEFDVPGQFPLGEQHAQFPTRGVLRL